VISVPAFSNDIFYLSVENLKNPKKDRIIKFKVGGKIQEPRLVYMGEAKIKNPEKKAKRFEINDFKKDDLLDNSVRVACCTQKTLVTGYGFPFKDLQIFNIKPNRELKHNHYCLYTKYKKRLNEGESFCLIEISNNGKFLALLNNKLEIKFFNTEEKVFFEEFIDLKKFKEKEETDFKFVFSKNSRFLILAIIITYEYEVDPELRIKVFSVENSKEINEVVYRVENSPDEDYLKIKQMKCSPSGRFLGILLSDGKLYPDFGLREILYKKN